MQLCLACRKFQAMNINIFATYFELKELIQYDYHAKTIMHGYATI